MSNENAEGSADLQATPSEQSANFLEKSAPLNREVEGPFDASELTSMRPYIDLGSIKIEPLEGLQVRLDVDQQAKRIVAVSLDYEQSTLQVQAFAAPKTTGLWNKVREELTGQLKAQSAKYAERGGIFNTEVVASLMTQTPDGPKPANVRFIGVDGPRWLLRGAITGKALVDSEVASKLESIFRSIVVVRGDQPMPPNELLPLKVPAGAQAKGD